jgi:hypothetical protein
MDEIGDEVGRVREKREPQPEQRELQRERIGRDLVERKRSDERHPCKRQVPKHEVEGRRFGNQGAERDGQREGQRGGDHTDDKQPSHRH